MAKKAQRAKDGRYGLLLRPKESSRSLVPVETAVVCRQDAGMKSSTRTEPLVVEMPDGTIRLAPLEWAHELSDGTDS